MIALDTDRAWDLLASQQLGRLGVVHGGQVEIFPVNYAVDGESIVFRTAEGAKLAAVRSEGQVTFEVDTWDEDHGYSVIVKGHAVPVTGDHEIAQAEALRLKPWIPTVKTVFVRIDADEVSARRFEFGPDPVEKYR